MKLFKRTFLCYMHVFLLFAEEFIDYATLILLNKEDIEKLVPQLGLRKKLLIGLQEALTPQSTEVRLLDCILIINY